MPSTGWVIGRLYRGQSVDPQHVAALPPGTWRGLADTLLSANGGAASAFDDYLATCPNADEVRAEVFRADPTQPEEALPEDELDAIQSGASAPDLPSAARLPAALVDEAKGAGLWLTDYETFAGTAAPMSPEVFHRALGLVTVAAAVARRVCLHVSYATIFPNLYVLLAAVSTLYRKTTALRLAERTLTAAGLARFILPGRMSPESMLAELTGRKPKNYEDWDKADRDDWHSEREFPASRLWLLDEASSLLDSFDRQYSAGLLPLVLDLYDCPDSRRMSTLSQGRSTIRNAYLTIGGATTPAALRSHLNNPAHWGNGLWARFFVITPERRSAWSFWPPHVELPKRLIDPLHSLALERLPMPAEDGWGAKEPPKPIITGLAPGVFDLWEAYAKALEFDILAQPGFNVRLNPSYGRLATVALKIAMLLAVMDWGDGGQTNAPVINMAHWARAQLIAEEWRACLHRLVEAPGREERAGDLDTRMLNLVRSAPAGLTSREIAQRLSMTDARQRADVDQALMVLKLDGLITQKERKGKRGPGSQAWVLANP
jgi:hypothetical protein